MRPKRKINNKESVSEYVWNFAMNNEKKNNYYFLLQKV